MTQVPRRFPIAPRSTRSLEIGDLVPVQMTTGEWGCLQVTDLLRSGPGSLKTLIVGVLPWRGPEPPTPDDVTGLAVTIQGMTNVGMFTEGGAVVTGNVEPVPSGLPSNFRDDGVGVIHHVWGWASALAAPEGQGWPRRDQPAD